MDNLTDLIAAEMSELKPMTVEELGNLIPYTHAGFLPIASAAQALWLINVGLSEVRRTTPPATEAQDPAHV